MGRNKGTIVKKKGRKWVSKSYLGRKTGKVSRQDRKTGRKE